MADENKFLHLGNSNDKIAYDKFKDKLEKKDIATNNKLLQIFNFFDKDGNGIIETANSEGVNEMQSLWNAVRTSATKNNNSIFEDSEAQELLENSVDSTGKSLADNQVTASDLFAFLKALITPQSKQANGVVPNGLKPEDIVEYTPEEIEDISIQTVTVGVRQAREVFDAQKAQQGAVSDLVDGTKENFDTEYASSRVDRYLMNEELCAQLLLRAKEGDLTEKEYLEAKIDLAMELIQSLEKYSLRTEVTQDAINISLSFLTLGIADKKETKNSRELKTQKLELENLKTLLAKLSPEEINILISQLLFIEENPEKNSNFDFSFGGKNNKAKPQTVTRYGVEGESSHILLEEYEGEAAPNSLESLSKPYAIYKKMTFEEVFEKERGVQYKPEAIMDYSTKEAHLQFLVGMHNRNEAIKNILHDATVVVDGNNKYGAPQYDAIETCNQNLANQIETAFRSLYSKNAAEAQKVIDEIMGQDSGIKVVADEQGNFIKLEFYGFERNSLNLDLLNGTKSEDATQESGVGLENDKFRMPVNAYSLVRLSKGLQQKLEDNYQTALNGKTLDDYSAEVKSAYQMAYGAGNAEDMANAFVQSQQEGVQNTKAVVQGLAMVAMVAGQLIPVGGQAATALIVTKMSLSYGGILTSTLGSVGVSAVENYTKAGGPTEEDKKAMLQELGTSLALVGSGMGIGKGSEAIFRTLVMKNCPTLIAFAAEVGVDATASLLADYAITGQIDLSGEGIAQLQNILVGIIGAKGAKNYLNTHAGDIKDVSGVGRPRNFGVSDAAKSADETLDGVKKRVELKELLLTGKKLPPSTDIHIPKGSTAAPSAKFAGTKEAYIDMLMDYAEDIAFVNKYVKNKETMAKFLNQIGNEGMDFIGIEHPFKINNNMPDRGLTAFDGSSAVEINTRRFGMANEFENDLAEMAHRVFHEKRHVYQNIQRTLGCGEDGLGPLELYSSDLASGSLNKSGATNSQYYNYIKNNKYDYSVAQEGRFPRNISNQDIEYGMSVSESQANYVSEGPEYWTQFVENDAEQLAGITCGEVVEDIVKDVNPDASKISKAAKAAYLAEKLGEDFDVVFQNPSSTIDEAFLVFFE